MEVLNLTGKKRETYDVQLTYSLLWESALGIAAITNTPILKTLEKSTEYWRDLKANLSEVLLQHLEYVEKNNTWKALLQLLHMREFTSLAEFTDYIENLSARDIKFISLPYIGVNFQTLREQAAKGNFEAIQEMKSLTKNNPFFSDYIEFICSTEEEHLKAHLIDVMCGWYEEVIEHEEEKRLKILQTDYDVKMKMKGRMTPEQLVEWSTGGVTYMPEPSVGQVLLIPQYIYRPWNIEADIEGIKVFYYPVSNESITPDDHYTPDQFFVLKHKALGDEVRMRMVKMLYEGDLTLHEMTDRLNVGKSTIHHHLKILRSAKLVEIINSKYSLKRKVLESLFIELESFLNRR